MKISLNWLRDFVEIPDNTDPEELGRLFTLRTAEVEHVKHLGAGLDGVVVGEMLEFSKHPDADKLSVAKVDIGKKEPLNLIFGQMVKMQVGVRIPVAVAPTTLPTGMKIEAKKLRGVASEGMLCLDQELGLKEDGATIQYFPDTKPGTPIVEAMNLNDTVIDIDNKSLTHRPDLWGHYGIAREIAAITDKKLKPFAPKVTYPTAASAKEKLSIEVKDKKLCPRYIGCKIEGVKIEESPKWLQERLTAIGYRSINNIVDATNYVMAELGQPLHAFDAGKVEGGIIVRTAKDKEQIQTLDETKRKLDSTMLIIADHKKPIAIAGVMGGANSEVDEKTTSIILEAANFQPSSVRVTSQKLGLRSEAVQRFEKSLDPNLAETAMDRACELILQICKTAKIVSAKIDVANFATKTQKITVDLQSVRTKIGADIETKHAIESLQKLEFKVKDKGKDILDVEIPSFRATKDINIAEDITEEIARMYGYENIEPNLPSLPTKVPAENTERKLKHYARQILSYGLGFDEVYNYSFYSAKDIKKCLIPEELHVEVANYLSEDQTHMRVSLVPNMLKNVVENLKHFSELNIYEIGRTYEDLQEYFPIEEKKICGMIVRPKKTNSTPFYEAKGALEELLSHFNTGSLDMRPNETVSWYAHPGRYAQFFAPNYKPENNNEIARLFEIHPLVLKNYDLEKVQIAAFEVNFTKLASLGRHHTVYKPIAKFPPIEFDVSVLVKRELPVGRLQSSIYEAGSKLVESVDLFDIYEGENIAENSKSCAFKITLRAPDRTLTDEEMKATQEKIFAQLKKLGGEIRGL